MQEDWLIKLAHLCLRRLGAQGLYPVPETDISRFERKMKLIGKKPNYPMLSPLWHDFTPANAMAYFVYSKELDIWAGVGARYLDLGSMTLAEHMAETHKRFYARSITSPVERQSPMANKITGSVVYFGELFVEKQRRLQVNLPALMYYLYAMSYVKWRPDWVYGYMRSEHIYDGHAGRYGFTQVHPGAQTWVEEVPGRNNSEFLVAISLQDICDNAEYYVRNPRQFANFKTVVSAGRQEHRSS